MSLGNAVQQYVTDNTHQSVAPKGQQIVLLTSYSGTAATTGTTSAKVGSATKSVSITISNITSVGGAAVTLQASNDPTAASAPATAQWTTLTTVASTVTTQTTYQSVYTDTTAWQYYRANTAANASTNTMTVVLNF